MQKTKINIKDKPLMPMKRSRVLMFTPKKIALIIFIVFVVLVLGYFYREICFLIRPPKLEVTQPPADISTNQGTIEIIGNTEPTAILTINTYNAYIDKDGNFKYEINLSEGVNTIEIQSKNRFNKVNTIIRRIIYNK